MSTIIYEESAPIKLTTWVEFMNDFDRPERLEYTIQGMEGYEFGSYVEWIDYRDLLEAYKELKFILEGLEK